MIKETSFGETQHLKLKWCVGEEEVCPILHKRLIPADSGAYQVTL
jgi:hypothetical protein